MVPPPPLHYVALFYLLLFILLQDQLSLRIGRPLLVEWCFQPHGTGEGDVPGIFLVVLFFLLLLLGTLFYLILFCYLSDILNRLLATSSARETEMEAPSDES